MPENILTDAANFPSKPLIVVCVDDHPKSIVLLRTACKRAQENGCRWRAVFVETPSDAEQAEDASRERMLKLLTLAEQMGGESVHVEAETKEKGLAALLEKEGKNIPLIVIGSVDAERWIDRFRPLPWIRLVRLASRHAQVEVVPLTGQPYHRSLVEKLRLRAVRPRDFLYALLAVGTAFAAALLLEWELTPRLLRIDDQNVALLFMIACAFTAGRFGLAPGLLASVASSLTMDYYFTAPYHQISLSAKIDRIDIVLFLAATVLISLFTSRMRGYAQKAHQRELSTQALFTLYRIASESFSRDKALEKLQQQLELMLQMDIAFFLPPALNPDHVEPVFPAGLALGEQDREALDACWTEMKTTGAASPFNPGTAWRFEPMLSPTGEIGALGVRPRGKTKLDAWSGKLLTAIADQTAVVLEHIELERSMGETRVSEEREKLRSMLLSAVSHDFKTPLAGIIGALSVHRSLGDRLAPEKRAELIEAAIEEAQRLNSFITNILDITRLESGNIQFHQEWHNVNAMIKNIVKRMQHRCRNHQVEVRPCVPDIEAYMDIIMTGQVLQNMLDNACKYTPAGTRIDISCTAGEGGPLVCQVRDYGPGLPPGKIDRVFDKYERLHKKDSQVAGTGLGLAISKAIVETQGGRISAFNHPEGGAVFTFSLPKWQRKTTPDSLEEPGNVPFEQAYRRH